MERGGEVPEHNCVYMTYGERRRGKEKEELEAMCEEGVWVGGAGGEGKAGEEGGSGGRCI